MTKHLSTRREVLTGAGILFAWPFLPKLARAEGRDPRMLTIVLRGALDGLAAVAPVGDPDWVKLRGDKALLLDGKRSEEHTSELQSPDHLVCRLLLEKKKKQIE